VNKIKSSVSFSIEQRLAGIGFMVASDEVLSKDRDQIDIEGTLAAAFVECASDGSFLRFLGPLLSWVEFHGASVIVEKLVRSVANLQLQGQDVSYAALVGKYATSRGLRRWSILSRFSANETSERFVGPPQLAKSLIQLRGEEEWSRNSGLQLPKGVVRTDHKWVLSRETLARMNRQYRNRLIYGAQWRSDIITAVELGANTPAEASRLSGASYEPCHRVLGELIAAGKMRADRKSGQKRKTVG
jgi:hypothetical protein